MRILITYDVETMDSAGQKRLRRVAKSCQNFGKRVQNSVFECILTEVQYLQLKQDIENIIDSKKDSIRFYHLPSHSKQAIETLGKAVSFEPDANLII